MTTKQTSKLLAMVYSDYPNYELTDATVVLWQKVLNDVGYALAEAAVIKVLAERQYSTPPTVGVIRRAALDLTGPDEPSADEAWGLVIKTLGMNCDRRVDYGSYVSWEYDKRIALNSLPLRAARIADRMGWDSVRYMDLDDIPTIRAQFCRFYDADKQRQFDAALVPTGLRRQVAGKKAIEAAGATYIEGEAAE